jgi:hypothetical protein
MLPARGVIMSNFKRGRMIRQILLGVLGFIVTVSAQDFLADSDRHSQVLFNGQVQVAPAKRYVQSFTTQSNFKNARIAGNIQAQGGTGNDIRVLVAKGNLLVFDSGKRRSVVLSVDCNEPGQYTLIFDNAFSLVSPKVVFGTVSLVHWGVDSERNETDREEAIAHYNIAAGAIRRLYAALKADERVWGTSQLFAMPTIKINNDASINAFANQETNTIQVNKGLFRVVDRLGEKGEDVLAAALSHEMSHIFYRHPRYGSTGLGVKGLFDELRGVTALDRIQEQEADILGIRVACQAGYDAQGMLILVRVFAQLDNSANSFMKNHPSGIERYNYLLAEAANCRSFEAQPRSTTHRTSPGSVMDSSEALQSTFGTLLVNAMLNAPGSTSLDRSMLSTQPPNASPVHAARSAPDQTADSMGDLPMWKLTQDPNSRWNFRISDKFLYAERVVLENRRKLGDFDNVDVKKQGDGDGYVGTQRRRIVFRIADNSPQGFHYNACRWDFAVQLTSVTDARIEGRWEGYPRGSNINPTTCERSGERVWEDVAWIRE